MDRTLFDALAAVCPEHVYDLEQVVQKAMGRAWNEGRDSVSVHNMADEYGDHIFELRAPDNPYTRNGEPV